MSGDVETVERWRITSLGNPVGERMAKRLQAQGSSKLRLLNFLSCQSVVEARRGLFAGLNP